MLKAREKFFPYGRADRRVKQLVCYPMVKRAERATSLRVTVPFCLSCLSEFQKNAFRARAILNF